MRNKGLFTLLWVLAISGNMLLMSIFAWYWGKLYAMGEDYSIPLYGFIVSVIGFFFWVFFAVSKLIYDEY
jgi:hypothetical protein